MDSPITANDLVFRRERQPNKTYAPRPPPKTTIDQRLTSACRSCGEPADKIDNSVTHINSQAISRVRSAERTLPRTKSRCSRLHQIAAQMDERAGTEGLALRCNRRRGRNHMNVG